MILIYKCEECGQMYSYDLKICKNCHSMKITTHTMDRKLSKTEKRDYNIKIILETLNDFNSFQTTRDVYETIRQKSKKFSWGITQLSNCLRQLEKNGQIKKQKEGRINYWLLKKRECNLKKGLYELKNGKSKKTSIDEKNKEMCFDEQNKKVSDKKVNLNKIDTLKKPKHFLRIDAGKNRFLFDNKTEAIIKILRLMDSRFDFEAKFLECE